MENSILFYMILEQTSYQYKHLEICLHDTSRYLSRNPIRFRYQTDQKNSEWYGGVMHLEIDGYALQNPSVKLAQTLMRSKMMSDIIHHPKNIVEWLEAKRCKWAVYDPRTSSYVPVRDVPDPALKRYQDRANYRNNSGCHSTLSVLAYDKDDAKRKLTQALANYNPSLVEQWINDGSKIMEFDDKAPTIPDQSAILAGWSNTLQAA